MEEKFEVKIEESNLPPQEAELRLYKVLEILLGEELDLYLNNKNYEVNKKKI